MRIHTSLVANSERTYENTISLDINVARDQKGRKKAHKKDQVSLFLDASHPPMILKTQIV